MITELDLGRIRAMILFPEKIFSSLMFECTKSGAKFKCQFPE